MTGQAVREIPAARPAARPARGEQDRTGRVALVTGGSGSIGRAVARGLAASGHRVAVGFAGDADGAAECVAEITEAGGEALQVRADVRAPGDVEAMFGRVEQTWGPVQVLVNNAGIIRDQLVLMMSDQDWEAVVRTNLDGSFRCMRRAMRPMVRARWGRIVSVGSVAGLLGSAGQANYSAAKAGLIGLSHAVAREVASRGVTVNTVVPGPIDTPMLAGLSPQQRQDLVRLVPMQRMGTADEVATVVTLLCSDSAAYITGAVVPVDGGLSMGC